MCKQIFQNTTTKIIYSPCQVLNTQSTDEYSLSSLALLSISIPNLYFGAVAEKCHYMSLSRHCSPPPFFQVWLALPLMIWKAASLYYWIFYFIWVIPITRLKTPGPPPSKKKTVTTTGHNKIRTTWHDVRIQTDGMVLPAEIWRKL